MQSLFKKNYLQDLPENAKIKVVKGKPVADWLGKNGKRKTAPVVERKNGTKAVRLDRKTWSCRFRDADGVVVERSTGCKDKSTAKIKLAQFVRDAERISAGVISTEEAHLADWRLAPVLACVDEYEDYLKRRGTTKDRVQLTKNYLTEGIAECDWQVLADISPDRLRKYLDKKSESGMGNATLNERITCWVAFGNWLAGKRIQGKRANWHGEKRLGSNPLEGFGKYDANIDRRRKRRAITDTEIGRLLWWAGHRPLHDAQTIRRGPNKGKQLAKLKKSTEARLVRLGRERVLIYKAYLTTGLRMSELASIIIRNCMLHQAQPYLQLEAKNEKNRAGNKIPITPDLAVELKAWNKEKRVASDLSKKDFGDQPLFNIPTGLLRILNRDLKAAGIPKVDENGYSVDVHALRHTFGTMLSVAEVAPRVAQQAMRHSKMELTMNVYTDPRLLDVHGAVNKLPAMNPVAPDEDEPVTVGGSEESESNMPPYMPPSTSQTESSEVTSSQRDGNSELLKKEEKPRQNTVLTGLSSVDDIGLEPTTSSMSTRRSSQLS